MKKLLLIGVAFIISACSDSKPENHNINQDTVSSNISAASVDDEISSENWTHSGYRNSTEIERKEDVTYPSDEVSDSDVIAKADDKQSHHTRQQRGYYTVQPNDTLMKIAFDIYGDYEAWKILKRYNSDKIGEENIIRPGMVLTYMKPRFESIQDKTGKAYYIERGDTLIDISRRMYGASGHWKAIWDNNKLLIKNPDMIFHGFILYLD